MASKWLLFASVLSAGIAGWWLVGDERLRVGLGWLLLSGGLFLLALVLGWP
jgi:uncharacterized membrane protein